MAIGDGACLKGEQQPRKPAGERDTSNLPWIGGEGDRYQGKRYLKDSISEVGQTGGRPQLPVPTSERRWFISP